MYEKIHLLPVMRRILLILLVLTLEFSALLGFWLRGVSYPDRRPGQAQLTQRFLLTDFVLSTESRHTRHLNTPEWVAPFQDFPAYLEHFPSSSFFYAETPQPD